MVNIGVLALQGSFREHLYMLSRIEGVNPCEVKTIADLKKVSGLILPGGESTTIGKLLRDFEFIEPLIQRITTGMPVWGTCAGMILLAKEIVDEEYCHLGLMDIAVRRNAYGSQLDSFNTAMTIPRVSNEEVPLVFIRAPWVERAGANVDIVATLNDRIIAVQQENMLATSFHPELTQDLSFHKYFARMIMDKGNSI
ncbi:MAG: pyridoxal 5'-phosphate synthase glutaminase subunit PdxT [Bacillota bacterium]